MRSVLLFAPQLGCESDDPRGNSFTGPFTGDRRPPALGRLLARSSLQRHPAEHAHACLCRAFGVHAQDGEWPIAALTLLADGHAPGKAYWLRADPVHLQARDADLALVSRDLALRAAEAAALVDALNRHFAQDGLTFLAPAPQRWYLRLAEPARIRTSPPDDAHGRSVAARLPRGPDALTWHRRANEAQMLLHDHPVNAAREDTGAPAINSIWFWGGGSLPLDLPQTSEFAHVWADAPLARGLALLVGVPRSPLPSDGAAWLETAGEGRHLVVLDAPGFEALLDARAHQLAQLDEVWLAPLLRGLASGRLQELTLAVTHLQAALHFSLTRADLWKVWRRGHDLARA